VKFKKFKKLSLFDLAVARVKNNHKKAIVKAGDLIEIFEPFTAGENFIGLVVHVDEDTMDVYHAESCKIINWNRRVNCKVFKV
tara:strand:- start:22 stop:270 length:249 start_codon:yes stop_codon:yes gene_type:complete